MRSTTGDSLPPAGCLEGYRTCKSHMEKVLAAYGCLRHTREPQMAQDIHVWATELSLLLCKPAATPHTQFQLWLNNCARSAKFVTWLFSSLLTHHHKSQSGSAMWESMRWLSCSWLGQWDELWLPDPALPHSWPLGPIPCSALMPRVRKELDRSTSLRVLSHSATHFQLLVAFH